MLGRIRALVIKELLAMLRDPRARFVLIGPPLVQLLVFSYGATLEVKNVDLAALNRDAGRWGTELLRRIDGLPTFRRVILVDNLDELRGAIDGTRVIAAVHIGPSYSRDIEAGRPAEVQLLLDGRRSNAAQIVGERRGLVRCLPEPRLHIAGEGRRLARGDVIEGLRDRVGPLHLDLPGAVRQPVLNASTVPSSCAGCRRLSR